MSLAESSRQYLAEILRDQTPQEMGEDALVIYEQQYGLTPSPAASLEDRRNALEDAFALTGAQGPGYIQARLQAQGFDVYVAENIPITDLLVDTGNQFGDYASANSFTDEATGVGFGEGFEGYLLGNGQIEQPSGGTADPVNVPAQAGSGSAPSFTETDTSFTDEATGVTFGTGVNRWGYVFTIEGPSGSFAQIPSSRLDEFNLAVLRLKPAHTAVVMKVLSAEGNLWDDTKIWDDSEIWED
jgi:hypothetical protein